MAKEASEGIMGYSDILPNANPFFFAIGLKAIVLVEISDASYQTTNFSPKPMKLNLPWIWTWSKNVECKQISEMKHTNNMSLGTMIQE